MSVIATSFPARRTLGVGVAGVMVGALLGLLLGFVLASSVNPPRPAPATAAAPGRDRTIELSHEHVLRENAGIQAVASAVNAPDRSVQLFNDHTLREYRSDVAWPAVDITEQLRQHHQREYGTP
jgi:hypothetical protein